MMDVNELYFLGVNKYGQAGLGEKHHNKKYLLPKPYTFSLFIKQISCGAHHAALLTIGGSVYTTGSNIHGALGTTEKINYTFEPILVDCLKDVSKIQCGSYHMCAIVDGDLYSWGKGVDGQLGHGNTKNISIPTKVNLYGNLSESVSCGTNHTLVLTRNNESDSELNEYSAYAFGNGIFGQLGSGSNRNSYSPVRVKLNAIEGLAAGDNHSLFLSHGKVYASGDNTIWQLGISSNKKYVLEPVELDILEPIVMVQARKISAGLTANGEVYVWGGKTNQPKPRKLKQVRTEPLNIIQICLGVEEIYAMTSCGSLYSLNLSDETLSRGGPAVETLSHLLLSNGRAILDFSIGDNYSMILGDIIDQVPYSGETLNTLQPIEIDDEALEAIKNKTSQMSQGSQSYPSSNFDYVNSKESETSDINVVAHQQPTPKNCNNNLTVFVNSKEEYGSSDMIDQSRVGNYQFSSVVNESECDSNIVPNKTSLARNMFNEGLHNEIVENLEQELAMSQAQSSSLILHEPSHFLKGSEERALKQSCQIQEMQNRIEAFNMKNDKKAPITLQQQNMKRRDNSDKQNEQPQTIKLAIKVQKQKEQKELKEENVRKQQKQQTQITDKGYLVQIDKIMQMLEKSNGISQSSEATSKDGANSRLSLKQRLSNRSLVSLGKENQSSRLSASDENCSKVDSTINGSDMHKSNRLLRTELRDKQYRISQLQEVLSRKEMEIEAQRQVIKLLRKQVECFRKDYNFADKI